jgi:bifunctional DNase/RNase
MVEVHLKAVRVDLGSNTPVLLLEELLGERTLAIFVGAPEATAIAYAVQGVEVPRPMTHDLICSVLTALGARLKAVVITELVEATYFAELHLEREGEEIVLSCRPSDAVAVALRAGTPIFVDDALMAAEGLVLASDDGEDDDEADPEDLVDQFREFLDGIDPDDFVSD